MATKKTIKLLSPYWGAGERFKWQEHTDDNCGFGVNVKLFDSGGTLVIHAGPKHKWGVYEITVKDAKEKCDGLGAYMMRGNVTLAVIPRYYCLRTK